MTYASKTVVPVDKTRSEIEQTLSRYGAKRFAYFNEDGRSIIIFESNDRRIRFDLPLPSDDKDKSGQIRRSRWRSLLLCIKAKLESVESKIETFEEAFLAHVVMPDGITLGIHLKEPVARAYIEQKMVPLLPAPSRKDAK